MRQQNLFVIFCLILTLGFVLAYGKFKDYFSDSKDLQKQVAYWREQKDRVELREAVLQDQMRDFEVEVARVIPQKSNRLSFEQKNLLSQVRLPASELGVDLSRAELERGRRFFREQNYTEATATFKNIIEKYPSSGRAVEARFLLSESLYLQGQYPLCIEQIEEMMSQYPENDLTGFIMLRMGQILQSRNRLDEANEVYRTVIRRFSSNETLKAQSQILLKNSGSL